MEMDQIIPSTVRRFIQDQVMNHKCKPRTIRRRISSLKSLSTYCLKESYLLHDFTAGIQTPKTDTKLPVYMTLLELQKLFRYLENSKSRFALRNHLMFKMLATTGMRRQELVDLTWGQVDISNQTIRVHGKGKKERLIPLHSMIVPLLIKYKATHEEFQVHEEEPMFLNKNGKKLNPRGLHIIFKKVLEKAGLPPHRFSLHHLRHTFATLLLQETDSKVDIKVIQELLGHESLSSTSIYTHVDFKQKKMAIDSLNLNTQKDS